MNNHLKIKKHYEISSKETSQLRQLASIKYVSIFFLFIIFETFILRKNVSPYSGEHTYFYDTTNTNIELFIIFSVALNMISFFHLTRSISKKDFVEMNFGWITLNIMISIFVCLGSYFFSPI